MPWLRHHRLFKSLGGTPAADTEAGGCLALTKQAAAAA